MGKLDRRVFLSLTGSVAVAARAAQPARRVDPLAGPWEFFTKAELRFVAAAADRFIPADELSPAATSSGVLVYLDRLLAGPIGAGAGQYLDGPVVQGVPEQGYQLALTPAQLYRRCIGTINRTLRERGKPFHEHAPAAQDALLVELESGKFADDPALPAFMRDFLTHVKEGYFADPLYGGNRGFAGWKLLGFPGPDAYYLDDYARTELLVRAPVGLAKE